MSVSTQYAPGTPFPSEFLEMENIFESCFVDSIKQASENEPSPASSRTNSSSSSASSTDTPRQGTSTAKSSPPAKHQSTPGSPLFTLPKTIDDENMENLWGDFNLYDSKPYYSTTTNQGTYASAAPTSPPPVSSIIPVQTITGEQSPPYNDFDPNALSNTPYQEFNASKFSSESRTIHGQITPPNEDSEPVFTEDIFREKNLLAEGARRTLKGKGRASPSTKASSSSSTPTRKSRKSALKSKEQEELLEAKRRRFLERNRVAASKCRQKKKAWMQQLEESARTAQTNSRVLHQTVGLLKNELLILKGELLRHHDCDCSNIKAYLMREADKVVEGAGMKVVTPVKPRQFSIAESEMSSVSDMFADENFEMIMGDDDLDDMDDLKM